MTDANTDVNNIMTEKMATFGVHFGARRSRRHPSARNAVFGVKNDIDIIDLEKTNSVLDKAKEFVASLAKSGKQLLLVGNKAEARGIVTEEAVRAGLPFVALRWIGGTFTNFDEIRKRIDYLQNIKEQSKKGEMGRYTKRERGKFTKEVKDLERLFGGIAEMKQMPGAIFVIDSDHEKTAVMEAKKIGIPVLGFASTDCDLNMLDFAIIGNDKSVPSISLITKEIVGAYTYGRN